MAIDPKHERLKLIVDRAAQIPGYMSVTELWWLAEAAANLEDGATWAEVGVFTGRSFLAVALALPRNSTLIGVDRWLGTQLRAGHRFSDTFEEVVFERSDLRLMLMKMSSAEAAAELAAKSFDVIFLDADHSEEAIRQDISNWLPNLKPGGLMCGHDYANENYPSVTKVIDELDGPEGATDMIWAWRP